MAEQAGGDETALPPPCLGPSGVKRDVVCLSFLCICFSCEPVHVHSFSLISIPFISFCLMIMPYGNVRVFS